MKLLFDQNLARRLVRTVEAAFPGSRHVVEMGLDSAADTAIWSFAAQHGYCIVSKDADFHHLSFRYGAPPKVIWLISAIAAPPKLRLASARAFPKFSHSKMMMKRPS